LLALLEHFWFHSEQELRHLAVWPVFVAQAVEQGKFWIPENSECAQPGFIGVVSLRPLESFPCLSQCMRERSSFVELLGKTESRTFAKAPVLKLCWLRRRETP
jgi:hypothetical protein